MQMLENCGKDMDYTMAEKNLDFDRIIDRRNTKSIKYDWIAKKGMPEDTLPLWVADMDFQVSSYIQEALARQTEHGIFGYRMDGEKTRLEGFRGLARKNAECCFRPGTGGKSLYGTRRQRADTAAGLLSFSEYCGCKREKDGQQRSRI